MSEHPEGMEPNERPKRLPDEFEHFKKVTLHKKGGMGDVYRAFDTRMRRDVALKTVNLVSRVERDRLVDEAHKASRVPNDAVGIYYITSYEGLPIIVMEFVDGHPLFDEHWSPPRSTGEVEAVVQLLLTAARALASIHAEQIVHGDFKPDNVMIAKNGKLKLIDFGLGQRADLPPSDEQEVGGSPAYMAPEQTRGKINVKTDMYSFGVVLHEGLTGELPSRAAFRVGRPEMDAGLSAIVSRCLADDPDDRYAAMNEVVNDLENWLEGEELLARPDPLPLKPFFIACRFVRRRPAWAAVALVLAIFGPYVGALLKREDRERERTVADIARLSATGALAYTQILRQTALALGAAPAPAFSGLIAAWNRSVKTRPASSPEDVLGRPERRQIQDALMELARQTASTPVDHWLAFDAAGTMVARTPEVSVRPVVGHDFHDRDYF
jgi:tRNA A-37 threonylcarbamoyl transferase component Bud32